MDRREFLKTTAAATAAALGPAWETGQAETTNPQDQPNLLFVLADQWRFSAFGFGTDRGVMTPHMDRLKSEGAYFRNAYATNPDCSPNRAVVLTGRYCHQTGMIKNNLMLPPTERCMADVLKNARYATHYIGKFHVDGADDPGFVPPGWRRRGFETFEGFNRGHRYHRPKTFDNEGNLLQPLQFEPSYQTDRAIDFLATHRDQPFYLYLSWGPPHPPYDPPEEFDRYSDEELKWRPNVPVELRATPKLRRALAGYYGLCTALDHEMGRLLDALEQLKLAEKTIVVFTSDHGDMLGSHGLHQKGHPEEESLHVPLLIRQPGRIPAKHAPSTLFSSLDLMPTLLGLCRAEPPPTCAGRNLASTVLGKEESDVESIYCQGRMNADSAWRALITKQHKLVLTAPDKVSHLIDLKNDPLELNNLANKSGTSGLQKALAGLLKEMVRKTGDPFPKPVSPAKAVYTQ